MELQNLIKIQINISHLYFVNNKSVIESTNIREN